MVYGAPPRSHWSVCYLDGPLSQGVAPLRGERIALSGADRPGYRVSLLPPGSGRTGADDPPAPGGRYAPGGDPVLSRRSEGSRVGRARGRLGAAPGRAYSSFEVPALYRRLRKHGDPA